MTPAELDALAEFEAKATQGKWFSDQTYVTDYPNGDGRDIALTSGKHCHENAAFIAAARNAVPELIRELMEARARVAELERERDLAWSSHLKQVDGLRDERDAAIKERDEARRERNRLRDAIDATHASLQNTLNATPLDSPDGTASGFDYEERRRQSTTLRDAITDAPNPEK